MAGSSTYPTTVDNKTALQDGVDYMEADNVNNAYVPQTATQTFIGANGKGASWSGDLLDSLSTAAAPTCVKASASSVTVSAGGLWIKNSGGTNRLWRKNTSTTTVSISNLDTGSTVVVGIYYIYAVADTAATTFTVKISTSASAPTGLTNFELIGWLYNEANGAALDLTNDFVGNVKAGNRNVPNSCLRTTTTDSSTSSATYVDMPETTIQFYSTGRPVLLFFKGMTSGDANARGCRAIFNIDGSDLTSSDGRAQSAAVQLGDGADARESLQLAWLFTPAAGAHTLKMRYLVPSGTTHVYARQTSLVEL